MRSIPLTRCQFLIPYVDFLEKVGAPTEALFEKFKLPTVLYEKVNDYIPILNSINFVESAACKQGIVDFGYLISSSIRFAHLSGGHQSLILRSPTLFAALRASCAVAHMENTNLSMHLELHGSSLRICTKLKGTIGIPHLEHSQWLQNILPVEIVRQFVGPSWVPATIAFEASYSPSKEVQACWPDTRFLSGQRTSWIDVPVEYLALPPRDSSSQQTAVEMRDAQSSSELIGCLKLMLPSYLSGKLPTAAEVAEMACSSTRSFQRALADAGTNYREVLSSVRFERAAHLLKNTNIRVLEIALSLGYSDAAHFTRAFQKIAGIPPLRFRFMHQISLKG